MAAFIIIKMRFALPGLPLHQLCPKASIGFFTVYNPFTWFLLPKNAVLTYFYCCYQ